MVEKTYNEIKTIKEYALVNKVPIMVDDSIDFIISKIHQKRVKKVLEIGTAIGYSAIMMALSSPNLTVTSIEKDKDRYLEAVKNIKKLDLEDRITLIYNDALEVSLKEKYDLILIDAAKSKNLDFFNKFEKNLEPNGIIITDNLSFHGYVAQDPSQIKNRNIRALVRKIRNYIDFLENNLKYKTTFYEIGDGLSVTEKRM
jgi:predicted O-methyltransferase YrrM